MSDQRRLAGKGTTEYGLGREGLENWRMGRKDKNISGVHSSMSRETLCEETASELATWTGGFILGESTGKYAF